MVYLNLFFLAVIVVYIIDLSGFTDAWKAWLWRRYKISRDQSIKPFDCSTCAVWWCGLIFILFSGSLSWGGVAYVVMLSLLALPLGQLLVLIRETLNRVINHLIDKL